MGNPAVAAGIVVGVSIVFLAAAPVSVVVATTALGAMVAFNFFMKICDPSRNQNVIAAITAELQQERKAHDRFIDEQIKLLNSKADAGGDILKVGASASRANSSSYKLFIP